MNNYADLYNYILKGKNKLSRTIANNTTARIEHNGDIIITLHSTDICILQPDNTRTFYTGGWRTSTTKERINSLLPSPYTLSQERGKWFIWDHATRDKWLFAEGIIITYEGEVLNAGSNADAAKADKRRKQIQKYAREYITRLCNGKIPRPDNGDCFYCLMRDVQTNRPLGDVCNNPEHLHSHMVEKYYVPSLFVNAIEYHPVSILAKDMLYTLWYTEDKAYQFGIDVLKDQGYKSLVKYMYAQFGLSR